MTIPLNTYYTLLQTYLWPQWRQLIGLGLLLLTGIVLQLIPPQLMRQFLDTATANGTLETLSWLAALVIGVVFIQQLCAVGASYLGEAVAWTATNHLRVDLLDHCLHLDLPFHHARTPGEMIERLDGDVTTLTNFFSKFVVLIVGNLLLLFGVLVLLMQTDWRVGLIGVVLALTMLLILARLRNLGVPYAAAHRQSNAELYAYLEERLGGLAEIRANGAVGYTMQRFYALMRTVFHKSLWENLTFSIPFATLAILTIVGTVAMLALCAWLFQQERISIGTIYQVFHYTAMLSLPINVITRQIEDLQRAGGSIIRLRELQEQQSQLVNVGRNHQQDGKLEMALAKPQSSQRIAESMVSPAVIFERVTFGYSADLAVLHDISFRLASGTRLGLLGRTGSGKSSLARLLLRFYDPTMGAIRFGHAQDDRFHDLREIPLQQLRQQVGLVTQQVQIFHATLRENLAFWNPTITDAQILDAFDALGLAPWLQGLPDGLETQLTATGGGLSAGEAQLVAFARIFLRNPGLVILDEASSQLDPTTEARLAQAVDRLLQGRTAIIIAHRLTTVRRVDYILLLEAGRIVEQGPRATLEADPTSRFSQLLQMGLEEVLA